MAADNIIDLSYTIEFYHNVKVRDDTPDPDNLAEVWYFLRENDFIDCNGQHIENGDSENA